ncbi:MAG: outer membrane protein assembly factor BamD [candidate division Zixibacteria bacterium]|nr:outer membrane protein assembly factor BamD [candidate division Zixibacteria bacterium]
MIQLNRDLAFVKVNGWEDTTLAKGYGISAYPSVLLVGKDGKEIDRIVGYLPPVEFLNTISLYLEGKETLADYLKRVDANPDSVELLFNVADKYEGRSKFVEARDYYQQVITKDSDNQYGFTDKAIHSVGYMEYRNKNFQTAIDNEKEIIEKYPDSELLEDANIYIPYYYSRWAKYESDEGNNREAKKLTKKAINKFGDFLKNYPDSEDAEWVKEQIEKLKES